MNNFQHACLKGILNIVIYLLISISLNYFTGLGFHGVMNLFFAIGLGIGAFVSHLLIAKIQNEKIF